jgi:glycerate kinase
VEGSGIHPLRVLVAPDSFKGSLSAVEAARAISRGVLQVLPEAVVRIAPVSDGGDGLLDVVSNTVTGTLRRCMVHGPLPGQMVEARWFHAEGDCAVIEMAEASGLMLVPPERRDPKVTTTRGVGELILDALRFDIRRGIIGIGGSGTNDGGAGMAEALGVELLNARGNAIPQGGASLAHLGRIVMKRKDPRLSGVEWIVASDVTNPLCGPEGASMVYGPQKGASQEDLVLLDNALDRYASMIGRDCGISVRDLPGAGAAGGLGAGLVAFCGAVLRPGIDVVLDMMRFDDLLEETDVVITGEGMLDAQTRFGKAVAGIVRRARRQNTLGVFGQIDAGIAHKDLNDMFSGVSWIMREGITAERAIQEAGTLLEERAAEVFRGFINSR